MREGFFAFRVLILSSDLDLLLEDFFKPLRPTAGIAFRV